MNVVEAWPNRIWSPFSVTRHSCRARAEAAGGQSSSHCPAAQSAVHCVSRGQAPLQQSTGKTMPLQEKCATPEEPFHIFCPTQLTHQPLVLVCFFFFYFSHNIFKTNIHHVTLVYNNTNQCKIFILCRSLMQAYL